jgi:hypothetical protein
VSEPQKQCPQCRLVQPLSAAICPGCSRQFQTTAPHKPPPDHTVMFVRGRATGPAEWKMEADQIMAAASAPQRVDGTKWSGPPSNTFQCAACGSDAVQKISAILQAGVTTGASSGLVTAQNFGWHGGGFTTVGVTNSQHHSASILAQTLAPPPRPLPHRLAGFGCLAWAMSAIAALAVLWVCQEPNQNSIPTLIVFASLAAALWLFFYWRRRETHAQWRIDDARWHEAMIRWDQLYYCSRCDCVYDPRTRQSAPSHQLNAML